MAGAGRAPCLQCPKSFVSPAYLEAHVLRRHAAAADIVAEVEADVGGAGVGGAGIAAAECDVDDINALAAAAPAPTPAAAEQPSAPEPSGSVAPLRPSSGACTRTSVRHAPKPRLRAASSMAGVTRANPGSMPFHATAKYRTRYA